MRNSIAFFICLLSVSPCTAEVIVCFPMDSNPNWTTEGQWEFGVPQGGGGPESYDPTSGYTGANVYGYNLAGNYENNIPEYCLTTSALNCILAENVTLSFWRWLGVELSPFDKAKIQVSNNATTWTDVWANSNNDIIDSSWVYCEYDISVVADRQPTVFVRWCMGPTDFSNVYAGWNIDDVCLDGDLLDALFISPSGGLLSVGLAGGPFEPPCKTYTLTNEDTSALNWTAGGTQSWLDITPGSGTLSPGASVAVEICINSTGNTLAEGKYTDTVSFTNTNSGFSHLVDVTLYVHPENTVFVPLQFPTIQSAIDASSNGDTIIVFDGTYTGRSIAFGDKAITLKSENGPESCIISAKGNASNLYRVFEFRWGETSQTVIDGFTIAGGWIRYSGPGIYCENSSPTIRNCIITSNKATDVYLHSHGAGIYCDNSSPTITNCVIKENVASGFGGGISCFNNSCPVITNCIIRGNDATTGGGMYNELSSPTLTNCTFSENWVYNSGGGMHNNHSKPTLTNCTFSGNSADGRGGGMHNNNSDPTLTNCTFSNNWAIFGGGMYNYEGNVVVTNCILWGNSDNIGQIELAQIWTTVGEPVINYSCIQGWTGGLGGSGNMGADPCFADSSNDDYHLKSQAGRWDANEGRWTKDDVTSLCIDAGDPMKPIGHEPFPNGGVINMGAYGGTAEASKSYFGQPLCETVVAGDINGDCEVNFKDFALMALHWLRDENQ